MQEIYNKVPCREEQLNDLFDYFGEYGEPLPCSLFISGNMGTGKTLCVETVLRYLGYKYVTVNCIECYSPKILYEEILSSLEDEEVNVKSDSMLDFINGLVRIQEQQTSYDPIVLIFDRAERLRSMDHSIICTFLRLRELCNLNICSVFITHLIYENFDFKMGVREPIKMYFSNYDKEELFKIILLHHKSFVRHVLSAQDVDNDIRSDVEKPELFANFLNAFLSVFYRPCRDLIELQHMARVNFVKYCEPIIKAEIQAQDLTKLWRHISPILKTSLELLYLRISNSKPQTQSPGKENSDWDDHKTYNFENTLKEELTSTKTFAQSFELPYYAKYLLIASYLASYNPPKEDKRLFMKNHGKQRKRMQQVRAKAKINEKLNTQLGPKVFTLDRLLAIFYAILEEKIGLTSNLLAQIATLVELKLIAGTKEIDLDTAKYKCIVGYDFISAISQTVGFNIRKYLYDFI
ncbi:origin recognition complex subunit 5 [Pectinophora gossypiella]|uniref:origin recognition complex subunit 5 n=1 Tax=Pectinophora gossypiella TaxID=13191 RepID=UPI00214EC8D7|nr:origin recognition complex subunit 5 [Pectinophora gossypiella]